MRGKMRLLICALTLGLTTPMATGQSAVRDLPPVYGGGVSAFTVTITITPPPVVAAAGLEDGPPVGWPVSNISNGGSVDGTGKIKWGPFFGTIPASVSYDLAVPGSANGLACCSGTVSFDGLDQAITGDACIGGPVPAVSLWGLVALSLSVLIGGTLLLHRRASGARVD
jgi:hypothetical protein